MVLGSLSTDLWFLHTKDSAQSYYSNELNKEDWVRPESENTQKNDWLGPRELSPHAQNQENKKRDFKENMDTRKLKPGINNSLFSDGFCSSAWMFSTYPFASVTGVNLCSFFQNNPNTRGATIDSTTMCVLSCSVVSDSLWPHELLPIRLLCPWGFSRQEYWSVLPCLPPGESSQPRNQTQVSCIVGRFLTVWATREVPCILLMAQLYGMWIISQNKAPN